MKSEIRLKDMQELEAVLFKEYGFTCSTNRGIQTYIVPEEWGTGYITYFEPCPGTVVSVTKMKLKRPIVMYYEDYDSKYETVYCMKGSILYTETGVIETSLQAHDIGIYTKLRGRGMMMYPSSEEIFAITLLAKDELLSILPCSEEFRDINSSVSAGISNALMKPRKADIVYSNLFHHLLNGQIEEEMYALHMEGAAKLLLCKIWQNHIIEPLKGKPFFKYSTYDMKAIRQANSILQDNILSPPTIPELAKMVTLNEYKLKNGFRELYGKTIYMFIRELRMKNAKELLENKELSIGQIAYEVGYINASHFARAFRQEFGVNPSDLRVGV